MKELKDKIVLHLMPVDFEGTKFCDTGNCAVSKAFKRQMKYTRHIVSEGVNRLNIITGPWTNAELSHNPYDCHDHFEPDRKKAKAVNFRGKEPIRTIVLNRVK